MNSGRPAQERPDLRQTPIMARSPLVHRAMVPTGLGSEIFVERIRVQLDDYVLVVVKVHLVLALPLADGGSLDGVPVAIGNRRRRAAPSAGSCSFGHDASMPAPSAGPDSPPNPGRGRLLRPGTEGGHWVTFAYLIVVPDE